MKGTECKLLWAPNPYVLYDRILNKWPDATMSASDLECFYYVDQAAKNSWATQNKGAKDSRIRAKWNTANTECWITVADPNTILARYLVRWEAPIHEGDVFDVFETDYDSFVRTVTVVSVTSKSFLTDDGIKWALRGHTPWSKHQLHLRVKPHV